MCGLLALLIIAVPVVEIFLVIEVGGAIGAGPTVMLLLATGIAGAALARHQGVAALRDIQAALAGGQQVGLSLIEGALILVAGCLLLTPGFLTDAAGFALLVPQVRRHAAKALARRMAARARAHVVPIAIGLDPGGIARRRGPGPRGGDPRHPADRRDDRDEPPPPGVIDV